MALRDASPADREKILKSAVATEVGASTPPGKTPPLISCTVEKDVRDNSLEYESDTDLDVSPFFSVDETGKIDSFGPSSALQASIHRSATVESPTPRQICNNLFANAALQRQREYELYHLPDIDGVPTPLAIHLLDLHWSRQHHAFLLTYRPAITRDLLDGGPNCSSFLLQSIFACSSKFSRRLEVCDTPSNPETAGGRFFRRCDELLAQGLLLTTPSIPTVVGLLLLGSTFIAFGITSKGWLYTGYALRMIYDLGIHLDCKVTSENAERVEIRRRVFWGAFICDKLQSFYLGRPVGIQLRDSHVSRQLMDMYEEKEISIPYRDPATVAEQPVLPHMPIPIYSISTFQNFCLLSKIMTMIINKFYVVGATATAARASLQTIEDALDSWKTSLPRQLQFESGRPDSCLQPSVMSLYGIYYSLIILLHRPLISDGHLRLLAPPESSWKRCTDAAREITGLVVIYQSEYTLRSAPYLLGYALYVACTIHVRNAAATEILCAGDHCRLLISSLKCLDELSVPNPGIRKPTRIIRNIMRSNSLDQIIDTDRNRLVSESHSIDPPPILDFDLEAVLRMFPGRPSADDGNIMKDGTADDFTTFGLGNSNCEDILYGFMEDI